jgi:hypothetical protein
MPINIDVGLSKKVGLPNYSSLTPKQANPTGLYQRSMRSVRLRIGSGPFECGVVVSAWACFIELWLSLA